MEPSTKDEPSKPAESEAPADALSRTPDDLEQEQAAQATANPTPASAAGGVKKPSALKRFLRRANVYFLAFLLILVITGVVTAVFYLNSQKPASEPNLTTQPLTQDALKQLANTDASVGDTNQTLTIQGNAIIAGQTLIRGALNVAGNIQTSGSIQGSSITISGNANLGATQVNSLQVATNAAVQGSTTLRDLSVAGRASFSGAVTASDLTVSRLTLSGNAVLTIPNHISFTGPSPGRTINAGVLGGGGSASVNGSDTTGTVNVNTGNSPSSGCFVRINFQQAFSNQPHVLVSPVGSSAGQLNFYVERDKTGFSICSTNAATANSAFAFDYFVTN